MSTRTSVQNPPDYFYSAQRWIIVILALALFCCTSAQAATRAQSWRIENDQDVIPVLIQKNADRYDPSDLLQNWKNGTEYIFVESKDDVDELASFMKANEMDGAQSVHFVLQTVLMRVIKHPTASQLTCRAFPRVSTLSKWHARRPNRLFKRRCKTFVANGGTADIGRRKAGSRSACTTSSSCTLLNSRGLKSIDRSTGAWGRNSHCRSPARARETTVGVRVRMRMCRFHRHEARPTMVV